MHRGGQVCQGESTLLMLTWWVGLMGELEAATRLWASVYLALI